MAVLVRAASFAAMRHRDQRRKDEAASPYINHPLALADVLVNEGGIADIETIVAALLHDTIEDTETTAAEIENAFGAVVRMIVE
ncbi:MAG: bifunctional (p)ppGpp synthetase/guanosine-3',5'-bis(diphosphate) 3'-pyrophosphohydrolase, partial [Gammaproteobacteria bacterium]|nr:bifunctional (p)ppGpp synthetase/guanosine-3',5'-bis(diphosphate) 3'-pyrophosphohydrolase [Gammaproteobacteria bacterium]